jgi:hypothetical protein
MPGQNQLLDLLDSPGVVGHYGKSNGEMGLECDWDRQYELEYALGFLLGYVPTFVVIVWISGLWTRGIDENCIRFTKYGYGKLMALTGEG